MYDAPASGPVSHVMAAIHGLQNATLYFDGADSGANTIVVPLLLIWSALNFGQILLLMLNADQRKLLRQEGREKFIAFLDDYFFMAWNTLCAVASAYFAYFLSLKPGAQIEKAFGVSRLDLHPAKNALHLFILADMWNAQYFICLIFVSLALITQFRNKNRATTYWWNSKFCKFCWYVRLLFLTVNGFLVTLVSWKLAIFFAQIFAASQIAVLRVDLLSPDGFGGLGSLGHLIVVTVSMLFVRALIGLFGIFDHTRDGKFDSTYLAGDVYNLFYGLFGIVSFAVFSVFVSGQINSAKALAIEQIDRHCGLSSQFIPAALSCDATQLTLRNMITGVSEYPFNTSDLLVAVFGILPMILALVVRAVTRTPPPTPERHLTK